MGGSATLSLQNDGSFLLTEMLLELVGGTILLL